MTATIIASADGTGLNTTSGTLAAGGTQDIYVGGTLTVATAQAPGVYEATNAIEITVAYN